jgi:hypothetical protein
MAGPELLTERTFAGHGEDGQPLYRVTFHGHAGAPETLDEWIAHRRAALGNLGTWGSGAVVVALLEARDDQAVAAAVAAGKALTPDQRFHILATLEAQRDSAGSEFPAAVGHVNGLISAWRGRYGAEQPKRQRYSGEAPR